MRSPSFAFAKTVVFFTLTVLASCDRGVISPPVDSPNDTTVVPPNPSDTIPPTPVSDAALTFTEATMEARLVWTAPHDDSLHIPAESYEIRFMFTPNYYPPVFWDLGAVLSDPPQPGAPGSREEYVFASPHRGKDLYVGIRSSDGAGNRSLPGNIAMVHIPGYALLGRCVNVLSGSPAEGLDVTLSMGPVYQFRSDMAGEFEIDDLTGGLVIADLSTGASSAEYYRIVQVFNLYSDTTLVFHMIPFQTTVSPLFDDLLQFFRFLTRTTSSDISQVLRKWKRRPVRYHAPPFVNGAGVDYAAEFRSAAQRWMDRTGEPLFTFVDSPPDTGITLHYKTFEQIRPHVALTRHTDGADGLPLRDDIEVRDDIGTPSALFRILLHELGHTIRLGHLPYRDFIMYSGQPLPDDISEDEVSVVKLHEALPNRVTMEIYSTPVRTP